MQLTDGDVKLRPLEESDLRLLVNWRNESSEWFFTSLPLAASEQTRWYTDYLNKATERMFIVEHVEPVGDGRHINAKVGSLALVNIDHLHRRAELGRVVMDRTATGRGYATAAIGLLTKLAFEGLNLHRLYVEVLADNEAAINLYRKCYFVEEGRLRKHVWKDGRYQDVVIMGMLRRAEHVKEWLGNKS